MFDSEAIIMFTMCTPTSHFLFGQEACLSIRDRDDKMYPSTIVRPIQIHIFRYVNGGRTIRVLFKSCYTLYITMGVANAGRP